MSHAPNHPCVGAHNNPLVLALAYASKAKTTLDMQNKLLTAPKSGKSSSADLWSNDFIFLPNLMQGIAILAAPTLSRDMSVI